MDSISSPRITASSILLSSSKKEATEKSEPKSIDTSDSFVKSSDTKSEKKLDFLKKSDNQPLDIRDGKLFLKDIAISVGVGAAAGCIVGGGFGLSPVIAAGIGAVAGSAIGGIMGGTTAVDRATGKAIEDMPVSQQSVDYQRPVYEDKQIFAGKVPTDYYVSGTKDQSKETPLKDSFINPHNPVLGQDGKPKMKNDSVTSEGKGTPSVTWETQGIDYKTPAMSYSESVSEKNHYDKVFDHYEQRTEITGHDYHGNPIYTTVNEPIFKQVKVVEGYQHSFSPDTKTEKIGEYKIPTVTWKQDINVDKTSLIIRDSLVGAGLGAAFGAIAGTAMAIASPNLL